MGQGLREAAVGIAGEGEVDVLAVDRAVVFGILEQCRQIDDRDDRHGATKRFRPKTGLQANGRLDGGHFVDVNARGHAETGPGKGPVDFANRPGVIRQDGVGEGDLAIYPAHFGGAIGWVSCHGGSRQVLPPTMAADYWDNSLTQRSKAVSQLVLPFSPTAFHQV